MPGEMVVAGIFHHSRTGIQWNVLVNDNWFEQRLIKRFLKHCKVQKTTQKGTQGNNQPVTDFEECTAKMGRSNLPDVPKTTFRVVICRVLNDNISLMSRKQLQASCIDVRQREKLIPFIEQSGDLKEP